MSGKIFLDYTLARDARWKLQTGFGEARAYHDGIKALVEGLGSEWEGMSHEAFRGLWDGYNQELTESLHELNTLIHRWENLISQYLELESRGRPSIEF
nr:WXG100 family type VII secretion target [Anaerolineae bacterium]